MAASSRTLLYMVSVQLNHVMFDFLRPWQFQQKRTDNTGTKCTVEREACLLTEALIVPSSAVWMSDQHQRLQSFCTSRFMFGALVIAKDLPASGHTLRETCRWQPANKINNFEWLNRLQLRDDIPMPGTMNYQRMWT